MEVIAFECPMYSLSISVVSNFQSLATPSEDAVNKYCESALKQASHIQFVEFSFFSIRQSKKSSFTLNTRAVASSEVVTKSLQLKVFYYEF